MDIKDLPPKYQKQAEQKLAGGDKNPLPIKSKYNAVKETVGNLKFDSKKERQRFDELMLMLKSGEIIKISGGRYTSYTWNWEKE